MSLCERCQKTIQVTVKDPMVWTRLGKMHYKCGVLAAAEEGSKKQEHKAEVSAKRSAVMTAVHARKAAEAAQEQAPQPKQPKTKKLTTKAEQWNTKMRKLREQRSP